MNGIRIGALSEALGIPMKTLRRLADNDEIPSARTSGGHRTFDLDGVRGALSGHFPEASIVPRSPADWHGHFELVGLHEDQVWSTIVGALKIKQRAESGRIAAYSFTEMLNNAIDHSSGNAVDIDAWVSDGAFAFRIEDDGRGVFNRLRSGLGLGRDIEAAGELTKGKRTTSRERHTGEGIFFTSKVVGVLRLSANGLRLTFDNARGDVALGISRVTRGTTVEASIPDRPARTLRDVFEEFTDDNQAFAKSRPVVTLFGAGITFVSRSEARRLMDAMDAFETIDIDFAGVEDVGQGFVDEALRVWPSLHPGIQVNPINMNEAVEFMVNRALRHT
jgi:anti-sigma regulatory factor (Ser/Thr protein kinase)